MQYENLLNSGLARLHRGDIAPQYSSLFESLTDWLNEMDLNPSWEKCSEYSLQGLVRFTIYVFYVAHVEQFKPSIRVRIINGL